MLEINGPNVSLIFKQAKAKEIFEYLANVGNFGFVWVKNTPNKESDIDNQRLISMDLRNVFYQKALIHFFYQVDFKPSYIIIFFM